MVNSPSTRERRAYRPARLKARIQRGDNGGHLKSRLPPSEPPTPASGNGEVCNTLTCGWMGRVSGTIVFVTAAAVLSGWFFGVESLIAPLHGEASMRANTALALLMLGVAILALEFTAQPTASPSRSRRNAVCVNAAGALACAAAAIGLLTLIQYAFGVEFGTDEFLASDTGAYGNVAHPGRPAVVTSAMMITTGVAIALTAWLRDRAVRLRLISAAATLLTAYVALLSHAYEAGILFKVNDRGSTAVTTAACFFFAGIAVLCINSLTGWMRTISGEGVGSVVVRRLLPLVLFGIPILGFLRMAGEDAGLFGGHYGTELFAITVSALIAGAVLWLGAQLNRQEERRILSETQGGRTQALLDGLVENSDSVIVIQGTDGRYVLVNSAFERQRQIPREKIVGRTSREVFPEGEADMIDRLRERVLETGMVLNEEVSVDGAGGPITFLVQSFPIAGGDGTSLGIGAIATDITERKEQETLTRTLNSDLERETARAHEAIGELEAFAHTVSHDLRSPLRAIDGFSRIVQTEYADALDDRGRRYLDLVIRSVGEMGELIDGLLEFSRLGRTEPELVSLDLAMVAREANERLATEREGRAVQFSIGDLPPVRADRRLMGVVFANLLSNAYKYTRDRDVATIQVGAVAAEPGRPVTYFVRDNGTGFDMRYADKLFGVFERLHRSEDYEGSGVGLATVQRIIRRHGGCVWAQSEPGKGTTIFFQLSRAEDADG